MQKTAYTFRHPALERFKEKCEAVFVRIAGKQKVRAVQRLRERLNRSIACRAKVRSGFAGRGA